MTADEITDEDRAMLARLKRCAANCSASPTYVHTDPDDYDTCVMSAASLLYYLRHG